MISSKDKILDISVNLARVSDWILNERKQKLIDQFLKETQRFVSELSNEHVSTRFRPTLDIFKNELERLLRDRNTNDRQDWAERALTWANILQHRAKLA